MRSAVLASEGTSERFQSTSQQNCHWVLLAAHTQYLSLCIGRGSQDRLQYVDAR